MNNTMSVSQCNGVRFIGVDPATPDPTFSQSILASMQACERLLGASEKDKHAVKTKLDECLAQLHALKLVLALRGIISEFDLEDDPLFVDILERAQSAKRLQEPEAKAGATKSAADASYGWTAIIPPSWGHPDGLLDERGDLLRAFSLSIEDIHNALGDISRPGAIIRVKP